MTRVAKCPTCFRRWPAGSAPAFCPNCPRSVPVEVEENGGGSRPVTVAVRAALLLALALAVGASAARVAGWW